MSSRRGCYDAVISGVIGPGQRGGSGGGHAKRGLRPQGAPAPQRGHCLRRRCRLRGAGAPSSRRLCQSLLGRRRGGTTPAAEAVTRSGGSVLKAPQRRRGGTPPRAASGTPSQTTNPRKPHSPASGVRLCLLKQLTHGSLTPPRSASGTPSLSDPYRVTGTLENSRTVPSGSPERTSASPMRTASAPALA